MIPRYAVCQRQFLEYTSLWCMSKTILGVYFVILSIPGLYVVMLYASDSTGLKLHIKLYTVLLIQEGGLLDIIYYMELHREIPGYR